MGKRQKSFSLCTFKFHALGHVIPNIKKFGCSDNYSTQGVCLNHASLMLHFAHPLSSLKAITVFQKATTNGPASTMLH